MRMLMMTAAVLALSLPVAAQWPETPTTGSSMMTRTDRTVLAGQVATAPDFGVRLVAPDKFGKQKTAVVDVSIDGVDLVDPATHPRPKRDEGHIVYKVDNGPEMTTTSRRFEIQNLPPGDHIITVYLDGNDNHEISPEHRLKVYIPA